MAVDAENAEVRERLDQRVGFALQREEHGLAVTFDLAQPGDLDEGCRGRGGGEGDLDASEGTGAQLVDRGCQDEPPVADQRDAVGDVLDLGRTCDERKTVAPAWRASPTIP